MSGASRVHPYVNHRLLLNAELLDPDRAEHQRGKQNNFRVLIPTEMELMASEKSLLVYYKSYGTAQVTIAIALNFVKA